MGDALGPVKTRFKNADDFIAYVEEVKPMILDVQTVARLRGDKVMLAESAKLLKLFANDSAILRAGIQKVQKPDGSIEMGISADAWALLRKTAG